MPMLLQLWPQATTHVTPSHWGKGNISPSNSLGFHAELIHTVGHDQTSRSRRTDGTMDENSPATVDRIADERIDFDHVL